MGKYSLNGSRGFRRRRIIQGSRVRISVLDTGCIIKNFICRQRCTAVRGVVVAQLVERLLPIPEVRRSNTVIGKNLY